MIGGQAAIVEGEAAQGRQFLRFASAGEGDALLVQFDPALGAATERTIAFSVRFPDQRPNARLVLTQSQTVELRPMGGVLEVSVAGRDAVRVGTGAGQGEWTDLALVESVERGVWDLFVHGTVAVSAIPLRDSSALMSDLLIFADGSVDLDAVTVSVNATIAVGAEPQESLPPAGPDDTARSIAPTPTDARLTDEERNELFAQAFAAAVEGRIAEAVEAVSKLAWPLADEARRELIAAQTIATLAYALRDAGLVRPAEMIGFEALRSLQRAREKPFASRDAYGRATVDFVAGQIWEEILVQPEEAERAYRTAATIDPTHQFAKTAADRIARGRLGHPIPPVRGEIGGGP